MNLNDLVDKAKDSATEAWTVGYQHGSRDAATRLRALASEVNVSVEQLRAEIEAEASRLEMLGRDES